MRRSATLVLMVLAAAMVLGAAPAPRPVAMVTDLVGRATDASGPSELLIQSRLRPGDRLRLAAGSWARVVFLQGAAGGRLERLTGPCTVEVGAAGMRLLSGAATALVVERQPVRAALVPGSNLGRMAGSVVRGSGNMIASTMRPAVEQGPPRFTFETLFQGPYTISVWDGDRELWSQQTEGTALDYGGPALNQDHTYVWTVRVADELQMRASFRLLSPQASQRLAEADALAREGLAAAPDDPTPAVLMLTLYKEALLLEEAASWAAELARLRPDDPGLHDTLSDLLYSLGRYEEARAEADRAAELYQKRGR